MLKEIYDEEVLGRKLLLTIQLHRAIKSFRWLTENDAWAKEEEAWKKMLGEIQLPQNAPYEEKNLEIKEYILRRHTFQPSIYFQAACLPLVTALVKTRFVGTNGLSHLHCLQAKCEAIPQVIITIKEPVEKKNAEDQEDYQD